MQPYQVGNFPSSAFERLFGFDRLFAFRHSDAVVRLSVRTIIKSFHGVDRSRITEGHSFDVASREAAITLA
jgi:hypothetical protein